MTKVTLRSIPRRGAGLLAVAIRPLTAFHIQSYASAIFGVNAPLHIPDAPAAGVTTIRWHHLSIGGHLCSACCVAIWVSRGGQKRLPEPQVGARQALLSAPFQSPQCPRPWKLMALGWALCMLRCVGRHSKPRILASLQNEVGVCMDILIL